MRDVHGRGLGCLCGRASYDVCTTKREKVHADDGLLSCASSMRALGKPLRGLGEGVIHHLIPAPTAVGRQMGLDAMT